MAHPAAAQSRLVTADELLQAPDDGLRRELVAGEVFVMAPAGEEHGTIAAEILIHLGQHVRERQLGRVYTEAGFKLASDPDTVLAPDVAFVRRERIEAAGVGQGYRLGAPDLAVEVVSPNDSPGAVETKALRWLAAGCRMVVVVNPRRRTATVYRSRSDIVVLTASEEVDGGDVVPGWRLRVGELFV